MRTSFSSEPRPRIVVCLQRGSRQATAYVSSTHAQKRERPRLLPPAPPRGISCDELHITRVIRQKSRPHEPQAGPTLRFAAPDNESLCELAAPPRGGKVCATHEGSNRITSPPAHRPPAGGSSRQLASAPSSAAVPGAATKMNGLMVSSIPRQDEILNMIMAPPYSGYSAHGEENTSVHYSC